MNKNSYPNTDMYQNIPPSRDIAKWLETIRYIYTLEERGTNKQTAIKQATKNWNENEIYHFMNWVRFYEGENHLKYKTAQLWYENGAPGYFLHIKPEKQEDHQQADLDNSNELAEKKQIIEKQRSKIISRLDSAEKLLRSNEGQLLTGTELENVIDAIYNLKKKIQLINKLSTSIRLYEDMIIREANILNKRGYNYSADILYKVAEGLPASSSPNPPTQGSGSAGGLPSVGPGMPQTPPESAPNENEPNLEELSKQIPEEDEDDKSKGINEFLTNMETANISDEDLSEEEKLEVNDEDLNNNLETVAQVAPSAAPPIGNTVSEPPSPKPAEEIVDEGKPAEEPLEVSEDDLKHSPEVSVDPAKFDNKVDAVFADLTIEDVIAKLEDLAKIFKVREIPRQLSIVDMMLDSMNMASFFPELSEALNKSIESSNYVSTRLDGILARLRGASKSNVVPLRGEGTPDKPEVAGIKQNLQDQDQKEQERKQLRKEQELTNLNKEKPQVEMTEDLQPKEVNAL